MARKRCWWEDHLSQVLLAKPAEVMQEGCQVLEKHGCSMKKKLKSKLYYSSTLCLVVFQVLHYAKLIVAHAPTAWTALIHIFTIFWRMLSKLCDERSSHAHAHAILLQWRLQVMLVSFAGHTCMAHVWVFVFECDLTTTAQFIVLSSCWIMHCWLKYLHSLFESALPLLRLTSL